MTNLPMSTPPPRVIHLAASVFSRLVKPRRPTIEMEPDDTRDRRDFLPELMDGHPDGFSSELDVQCMMHLYPGRY